jgi:hypothetical protein
MAIAYFITHPEVAIDPSVPVPDWPLSSRSIRHMALLLSQPWVRVGGPSSAVPSERLWRRRGFWLTISPSRALSSIALARMIGLRLGICRRWNSRAWQRSSLHARRRACAGWERAVDAQRRIVEAVDRAISMAPAEGDMAIISHGGVGALLLCHLKGVPISRAEDQPETYTRSRSRLSGSSPDGTASMNTEMTPGKIIHHPRYGAEPACSRLAATLRWRIRTRLAQARPMRNSGKSRDQCISTRSDHRGRSAA